MEEILRHALDGRLSDKRFKPLKERSAKGDEDPQMWFPQIMFDCNPDLYEFRKALITTAHQKASC